MTVQKGSYRSWIARVLLALFVFITVVPLAACDDGSCSYEPAAFDLTAGLGIWLSQSEPIVCEAGFNGSATVQFNDDGTFSFINGYAILYPDDPGVNPYMWDDTMGIWHMCGNDVWMMLTESEYTWILSDGGSYTSTYTPGATWELTYNEEELPNPVSYTHLTLPTIYSV